MNKVKQEVKHKNRFKQIRSAKFLLGLLAVIFMVFLGFVIAGNNFCKREALFFMAHKAAQTEYETVQNQFHWHLKNNGVFGWGKDNPEAPDTQNSEATDEQPSLIKLPPCELPRETMKFKSRSGKGSTYKFASPQPLNLNNITNTFEQDAIDQFKHGKEYVKRNIKDNSSNNFQIIFPIIGDDTCFSCHTNISDKSKLVGTFTITYDMNKWEEDIPSYTKQTIALCLLVVCAMVIIAYLFTQKTYATKVTVKTRTQQATADFLTGLLNRTALFEFIEREIMRARRFKDQLCLVLIDIDHFSEINDRYGSKMGDAVLIATAKILESQVREYDIIGRSGGNEFLLLLPQTSLEIAEEICNRLISIVEKTPVTYESHITPVTISTGLAEFTEDENFDMFMSRAKGALSNAKANGGNRMETDDVFRIKK